MNNATSIETDSPDCVLVRVGLHGQVGRFRSAMDHSLERGIRVVCRTARGVELGNTLGSVRECQHSEADGRILRRMTPEDELLWSHLQQLSHETHAECERWLIQSGHPHALLDVEPLLDGRTLYFHFLTAVTEEIEIHVAELANIFERRVAKSEFAEKLENGCGPGCGTKEAAAKCGTACAVCKISQACHTK